MRILVTGANGFVGRALLPVLAQRGHDVVGVSSKVQNESGGPAQWIAQDLSGPIDWRKFPSQVDGIIHLAQSQHYRDFPERAADIFAVNVSSTMQLLEYARKSGVSSFILTSSGGVYGYSRQPLMETDVPSFVNFYQGSKFMAESMTQFYSEYFSTIVLRPFFVYGEGQKGMLLPGLIERIDRGDPVTLYSQTGIRLNPVHAEDMVEVVIRTLQLKGREVLNVAGPDVVPLTELAHLIGAALQREPRFEHKAEPHTDDLVADIKKLKMVLAYEPRISLREGVRRMVEAYVRNKQRLLVS